MPQSDTCPQCQSADLEREAAGVWQCPSCGHRQAGGAYEPDTGAEQMLRRAKKDELEELDEAKEELEV